MNKLILTSLACILLLTTQSCNKRYNCTCYYLGHSQNVAYKGIVKATDEDKAKQKCQSEHPDTGCMVEKK